MNNSFSWYHGLIFVNVVMEYQVYKFVLGQTFVLLLHKWKGKESSVAMWVVNLSINKYLVGY